MRNIGFGDDITLVPGSTPGCGKLNLWWCGRDDKLNTAPSTRSRAQPIFSTVSVPSADIIAKPFRPWRLTSYMA